MISNTTTKNFPDVRKKLQKALSDIDKPFDLQKKAKILTFIKKLLNEKIIKQTLENLKHSNEYKCAENLNIEKQLLQEYDTLKNEMLSETKSPAVIDVLETSNNKSLVPDESSYLEWREAGICVAFYYFMKEKKQLSHLETVFSEHIIKNISATLSQNEKKIYLQEIKSELSLIDTIMKSYDFIDSFDASIVDDERWNDLYTHIYRLLRYINKGFISAALFTSLKIEKISWEYTSHQNPKKASLIIKIDDIVFPFKGMTATTLYKALQDPYESIEHEAAPLKNYTKHTNKKGYDAIYRRIENINAQLLKTYFAYNLTDFLLCEGYSYQINPEYADFIEPV